MSTLNQALENLEDDKLESNSSSIYPAHFKANKSTIYVALAFYSALLVQELKKPNIIDIWGYTPSHFVFYTLLISPFIYFLSRPGLFFPVKGIFLQITSEALYLPQKIHLSNLIKVNFSDIKSIIQRGNGNSSFLTIKSQNNSIQLPASYFKSLADYENFKVDLLSRIRKQDKQVLFRINNQQVLSDKFFRSTPYITITLLILLIASFIWQNLMTGGAEYRLPGVGANSSLLLAKGEWFRLVVSGFLHANSWHLALNLLSLAALGFIIEAAWGASRMLLIFVVALFFGSLASALSGSLLSVGASAAIFGLMGSFLYLHLFEKERLPDSVIMSRGWWIGILIFNLLLAYFFPAIDSMAHLSGLLSGFVATLTVDSFRQHVKQNKPTFARKLIFASSGTLAFLTIFLALFQVHLYSRNPGWRADSNLLVFSKMLSKDNISPYELNSFAWSVATDPKASADLLILAEKAARKAIVMSVEPALADTLATVYYRMGLFEKAISIESVLVSHANNPRDFEVFASQLARFIQAKNHFGMQSVAAKINYPNVKEAVSNLPSGMHVFSARSAKGEETIVVIESGQNTLSTKLPAEISALTDFNLLASLALKRHGIRIRSIPFSEEIAKLARANPSQFIRRNAPMYLPGNNLLAGQLLI